MAANLPATIIEALLADERLHEATQDVLARWATRQTWGYAVRIDEDLNVQLTFAPENVGFDGDYGDRVDDPWAVISFKLVPDDGFGDAGGEQAKASADKLRALADEIERSASAGFYGWSAA